MTAQASRKIYACRSLNWAPPISRLVGTINSGIEMYCLPHTSAAVYWSRIETPIAVMSGASRGARRSGR